MASVGSLPAPGGRAAPGNGLGTPPRDAHAPLVIAMTAISGQSLAHRRVGVAYPVRLTILASSASPADLTSLRRWRFWTVRQWSAYHKRVMEQALVLNASYEPLTIVNWQKAITLWCQGKVEVIAVHDREIRAVSFSVKLPSVIRLLRFVRIKRRYDYVPFSRANIYARDHHTCQYCSKTMSTTELTFDHVVPVTYGGRKDWENIVTCCVRCNRRKGGRTPAEAGMRLRRAPKRPSSAPAARITIGLRDAPESWRDYLYWNLELDKA